MSSFILVLLCTLYATLVAAIPQAVTLAAAPVLPPKGKVTLTTLDVDLEGSGCRPGDASVMLASDNSAMTVIFDNFSAADGPKNGGAVPARSAGSADFRGYVYIEKGVNASLVSRWKWIDKNGLDLKGKGNIQKKITGPFEDDFLLHKDGEVSDTEASVCQKKDARIQISLSATVDSGTSKKNGYVQGGSADAAFGEILNLSWKKC
ncbi:unnamed protein product [Alternaria alternata]